MSEHRLSSVDLDPATLPAATAAPKKSDTVEATIAAMTLEQKVGQLFVPYVTGGTADTASAENRTRFGVDTPAQAHAVFLALDLLPDTDRLGIERMLRLLTDDAARAGADLLLSFGRATWPHLLARAMLAEQLFRATSILANHPYHREG